MELVLVTDTSQLAGIQRVLDAAPEYALRVTGHRARADEAANLLAALPEGCTAEQKFVWAIDEVGVADVIRGWPDRRTAMLGLLVIAQDATGRGLGRQAYQALEAQIMGWPEITRIRLGVVDTNAEVTGFWQRMGFRATGEAKPYAHDSVRSTVRVFTKELSTGLSPVGD